MCDTVYRICGIGEILYRLLALNKDFISYNKTNLLDLVMMTKLLDFYILLTMASACILCGLHFVVYELSMLSDYISDNGRYNQ